MITIHVTEDDIKRGQPEDCYFCPIALAAKRDLKEKDLIVTSDEIIIEKPHRRGILLPYEAANFVFDFDHDVPVQPINFEIDI